jgi:bifunctional non-homologous end joining protein LigD
LQSKSRKDKDDEEPEPAVKPKQVSRLPAFVEPQLCRLVDQPPSGPNWVHEVKFDGYRMQLRVENGKARLLTRKGLDWTNKSRHCPGCRRNCPTASSTARLAPLDHNGAPDFAALQAALSDGKSEDLIFFAFDLSVCEGEDLRPCPYPNAKRGWQALLEKPAGANCALSSISPAAGRGAAIGLPHESGRHRLQAA